MLCVGWAVVGCAWLLQVGYSLSGYAYDAGDGRRQVFLARSVGVPAQLHQSPMAACVLLAAKPCSSEVHD